MALSTTPDGYLPSRHPKRKRYHRPALTFQAWDTVVRELAERRDRLSAEPSAVNVVLDLDRLIASLRHEWQMEDR